MKRADSGILFAGGTLLCMTIQLALEFTGLLRASPVQFPGWAIYIVAVGLLVGPLIFTLMQSLHWAVRLLVVIVFFGCNFVLPWFYHQRPVCFWLVMLLLWVEAFAVVPWLLKRKRSSRNGRSPEVAPSSRT